MTEITRVAVLGAGALGAFYASRFARAGIETCLVATAERAAKLRRSGIRVNGEDFLLPVCGPETRCEPVDLVLVAVKHHQLADSLPLLQPLVGKQTLFLSVLNGLDSETVIGSLYGAENVLYCIAVGIDGVRRGDEVIVANDGRLSFGEAVNTTPSEQVVRVQSLLQRAGLAWETPADMQRTLWWKFMVNVGVNQASAVLRAPYRVFQQSEAARRLLRTLMGEVIELAVAAGIDLRESDLDEWERILAQLDPAAKTSMLQDVEAGRKTEVDIFAGKVVALGEQYGVKTPANAMMLELLQVVEEMPVS